MTKKDPIPPNVNRQELARFWNTHSVANYTDGKRGGKTRCHLVWGLFLS